MPTKPLVNMTLAESDQVPLYIQMDQPQTFQGGGGLDLTITPHNLGGGLTGFDRADLFILYIIRDAFPERSIFFSRTAGPYPEELGFTNRVVGHGLARKLVTPPPIESDSIAYLPSDGWFDLGVTYSLWSYTFEALTSLTKLNGWVDKPSIGIPYTYVRTGYLLAEALQQRGRSEEAKRVFAQVEGVIKGAELQDLIPASFRSHEESATAP